MKKAILLNSTSTYNHIGCYLTSIGLRSFLYETGIKVIAELEAINSNFVNILNLVKDDHDILLVINGEGTFHDDQPYALELLRVSEPYYKRTIILNTQMRDMGQEAIQRLREIRLIQPRTKRDLNWANKNNLSNTVYCPDMLFFLDYIPTKTKNTNTILFTDSHSRDVTKELAHLYSNTENAEWINFHYKPLQGNSDRLRSSILRILRWMPLYNIKSRALNAKNRYSISESIHRFSNASIIATGRYHAACLAIQLGKPLLYSRSNTTKVEDLADDFSWGKCINQCKIIDNKISNEAIDRCPYEYRNTLVKKRFSLLSYKIREYTS